VVISYTKEYRGNGVYRVVSPEILAEPPDCGDETPVLMGNAPHLYDALESLGLEKAGVWAGYFVPVSDSASRVIAWTI
jgi:hypothetical protein